MKLGRHYLLIFAMLLCSTTGHCDGIITFSDDMVKSICITQWDTNTDGNLSKDEAAVVTSLGTVFKETAIVSFDELQYFTGLSSIATNAFQQCTSLESIVIPANVTTIGNGAFNGCTSLASIDLANVDTIRMNAFNNCTSLTSLKIPASMNSINRTAFNGCDGLKRIEFECPEIGVWFDGKDFIEEIVIGSGVTTIAKTAFKYCDGLTSVSIPDNVTSIGVSAFEDCKNLLSVTLGSGISAIPTNLFTGCTSLESIVIPSNYSTIGNGAFNGCTSLASIDLANVDTIKMNAFNNCTGLTSLKIPASMNSINRSAFNGCDSLKRIEFECPEIGVWFDGKDFIEEIVIGSGVTTIAKTAFKYCDGLTSVSISDNVTSIGVSAFEDCKNLLSVTLGSGISAIPSSLFTGCTSLESILLPDSLTSIGSSAFKDCTSLKSIILPDSLTSIGSSAFENCTSLKTIVIPSKVSMATSLNFNFKSPFTGCTSLEKVTIDSEKFGSWFNDNASIIEINIGPHVLTIVQGCLDGCSGVEIITVSENNTTFDSREGSNTIIETVNNKLIAGCKTSKIPESVVSIGATAFENCTGLTEITIPRNITSIGKDAFSGCINLKNVYSYIKQVKKMKDNNSFFDEETLLSATLYVPYGMASVYSSRKFWKFENILEMEGTEAEITMIDFADIGAKERCVAYWDINEDGEISIDEANEVTEIPNSFANGIISSFDELILFTNITNIGDKAFFKCKDLSSILIPVNVTTIGESSFEGCSNMRTIDLPKGLVSIGKFAFYGTGLTRMTIPASVIDIGEKALAGLYIYSNMPLPTEGTWQVASNPSDIILYVPEGSEEKYKAAEGWKDFIYPQSGITDIDWKEGAVTVNVPEAGQLRATIAELDITSIARLIICGKLNSEDLKYLHEGAGKIADLESIDLENVTLVPDDELYYYYFEENQDVMWNGKHHYFYLSETEKVEIGEKWENMTMNKTYSYYGTDLAGAFIGMGYKHVVMPASVKSAGALVFSGCSQLEEVEFPDNLIRVEKQAFSGTNLQSINLENVDYIGAKAFRKCMLQTINLEKTDSIGEYAFEGCSRLLSIGKTDHVKYIGSETFSGCTNLRGDDGIITFVRVDSIPYKVFYGCKSLEGVRLSDRLYYIGESAFGNCSNLNTVSYPSSLINVDYTSFENTPWMSSLTSENGVIYMGSIAMGYNFESGATDASVSSLSFRAGTTSISNNIKNSLPSKIASNITEIIFPTSLRRIGDTAFSGNYETMSFPVGLEEIGYEAFYQSENLKKVVIPEGIKKIGSYAFARCNKLSQVIYNAVDAKGNNIFSSCEGLDKVIIGDKVKVLPDEIFNGCKGLVLVKMAGVKEPLTINDNTFSNTDNAILYVPFGSKEKYESAEYWKGFKEIVEYYVEGGISYIPQEETIIVGQMEVPSEKVVIPESIVFDGKKYNVSEIAESAFEDCNQIAEVSIPASVESIGVRAFGGCIGLKAIYEYSPIPVQLVTGVRTRAESVVSQFDEVDMETCVLYIPVGSKSAYMQAEGWKEFKNIVEMGETYEITIGKNGKTTFCGDKSLDFSFSDEVKAFIATGFDKNENTIWMTRVKDVPAGVPVMIKGTAEKTYEVPVTDSKNSYYKNMFVGNPTSEKIQINETSDDGKFVNYYMSGGQFKSVNGYTNISPGKCYLQLPANFEDETTGEALTIKIAASGKSSFAAPYDLDFTDFGENLKAFTATGFDKSTSTIWLTRVKKVQKGEGLMLKGNGGETYTIPSTGVQAIYENMIVGNIGEEITIYETSDDGTLTNYYLKGGTYMSVSGNANIGKNKSYLQLPTSMLAGARSENATDAADAQTTYGFVELETESMPIIFASIGGDDVTTGIVPMDNGQLIMDNASDEWYTISGQRISKPTKKGLYIHNGKKVVIR